MNKNILTVLILMIIPVAIGLPVYFMTDNPVIMEVFPVVFGLLEFIVLISRINRHDRENRETLGTFKSDKASPEYQNFIRIQNIIFLSGALNILSSYLYFLILGA